MGYLLSFTFIEYLFCQSLYFLCILLKGVNFSIVPFCINNIIISILVNLRHFYGNYG